MANDSTADARESDAPVPELVKLQFDYAWKWFAFHADQRIKMFNYMWIVTGLFVAGVGGAVDRHKPLVAIVLCGFGGLTSFIFILLDGRNYYLVRLGEDILEKLESDSIFPIQVACKNRRGQEHPNAILLREPYEQCFVTRVWQNLRRGKHRFWLPILFGLMVVLFVSAAFFIWCHSGEISARVPDQVRLVQ